MKKTIWQWLSLHSHIIVVYVYWSYFIGYVIAKSFLSLPIVFDYILCALGGIMLGYKFALRSVKMLKKNKLKGEGNKS